jgi:heat shock protein HslJ
MKRTHALIVLLAVTTAACGASVGAGGDPTTNAWAFESGTLNGEPIPYVDGHPITMLFDETGVGGQAACNQYFGGYELSGSEISFSELGQTMMACLPEEVMDSEAAYLEALASVDSFGIDGNTMTLTGEGVELVFVVDEDG